MKKLAIVTTHPIQYYAPVFKLLSQRGIIDIKVFYTWGESSTAKFDPGFNRNVSWDIDLLDGYPFEWAENTATKPGSDHFNGIITPALPTQIARFKPDALLIIGWAYRSHLNVLRHFKNKLPIFFRGDSTLLDENKGLKNLLKSILLKWVYKLVDHAFYNGINNKAYFEKYGLTNKQLTFAPHAIDNERFAVDRYPETNDLRKGLGIADGDVLILFAGKLEEKKDPLILLRAFLQLNKPNCHLLFAGNGPLENSLKTQAGTNPNIHFMDFQNQLYMPVLYQACDIFCLPSKGPGESWGLAVNEAMACVKAVLVSDKVGCAADLVTNGVNGAIFAHGDVNALCQSLENLTLSKTELKNYGIQSAKTINDWNFVKIAEAIESRVNR